MAEKTIASFGLYPTYADLENAIRFFSTEGFRDADISVLMPKNIGSKHLAPADSTKAPEDGGVVDGPGANADGALSWFTAIGVLAIPGAGPFLAAGPIVAAFTGTESVGVTRGIAGALSALGILSFEARRLERHIWDGQIFISVDCGGTDCARRVTEILESTGASDVSSTEATGVGYASTGRSLHRGETGEAI
ncbi:MAG TPA: DUF3341 domain-containing protein [Terriglobia bacterium]|nr:DUF3341 domain-containing protein [Terriglobia bacterium]